MMHSPGVEFSVCSSVGVELSLQRPQEEERGSLPSYPRRRRTEDTSASTTPPPYFMYLEFVQILIRILLSSPRFSNCLLRLWLNSTPLLNKPFNEEQPNFDAGQFQPPSWFSLQMKSETNCCVNHKYAEMLRDVNLPPLSGACTHDNFSSALSQATFTNYFVGDNEQSYQQYCQPCISALQEIITRFIHQRRTAIHLNGSSSPAESLKPPSSDFVFCFCHALAKGSTPIQTLSICGPFEQDLDLIDLIQALREKGGGIESLKFHLSRQDIDIVLPRLHTLVNIMPSIQITAQDCNASDSAPLNREQLRHLGQAAELIPPTSSSTVKLIGLQPPPGFDNLPPYIVFA